jgi:predicted AlkP superfamily phosphohydrolase/phosphomutase
VAPFAIGDRVRVSDRWFVAHLRGAQGIVIAVPNGVPDRTKEGVFWIEFDEPLPSDDRKHPTDAAEIDSVFLDREVPAA